MSPWLFLNLLLLPIAVWWYGVRVRRLSRRFCSWVSRLKLRFLAALQRRLLRLLTEPAESGPEEEAPRPAPLHPRP